MNTQSIISTHYNQLLGLTEPWKVEEVKVYTELLKVNIFVVWPSGEKAPCPVCQKPCRVNDHREERSWRHLDTMQFETIITCRMPRVSCPKHGVKTIAVPWADNLSRFTALFEHFAIDVLLASKSIKHAMALLRLSWDQIHAIQLKAVKRGLIRRNNDPIDHVGIDEKNFGKGHSYVSILTDIDRGRVLDVVKDRTMESAKRLINLLSSEQKQGIKAITMDMWDAFMTAAKTTLPQADIVHDKFHIASYLSKAVDEVRRKENKLLNRNGDKTLKGTKFLWLTNPDNWKPEDKQTLALLPNVWVNWPTGIDYQLVFTGLFRIFRTPKIQYDYNMKKVKRLLDAYRFPGFRPLVNLKGKFGDNKARIIQLVRLEKKPSVVVAERRFFDNWKNSLKWQKLEPYEKFTKLIERHWDGIAAYSKPENKVSLGFVEGLNNKIRVFQRRAYGLRDEEYLRLKVLACMLEEI